MQIFFATISGLCDICHFMSFSKIYSCFPAVFPVTTPLSLRYCPALSLYSSRVFLQVLVTVVIAELPTLPTFSNSTPARGCSFNICRQCWQFLFWQVVLFGVTVLIINLVYYLFAYCRLSLCSAIFPLRPMCCFGRNCCWVMLFMLLSKYPLAFTPYTLHHTP